jgi:hypothetical protein
MVVEQKQLTIAGLPYTNWAGHLQPYVKKLNVFTLSHQGSLTDFKELQ